MPCCVGAEPPLGPDAAVCRLPGVMRDAIVAAMRKVAVVGAVVFAGVAAISGVGCLISPIIPIGSGKSSRDVQHEGIEKLVPAQLTARGKWKGEVRVAEVRVWADDDYRAQNVRWQHGFDEQLDYANQVFTPMLGVRLEPEYRSWERHAPG